MTPEQIAELRKVFGESLEPESWHDKKVLRLLDEREALLKALVPIVERLDGDREFVIPDGGAEMLIAARDAIAKAAREPACDCALRIGDHHLATCATRKPRDPYSILNWCHVHENKEPCADCADERDARHPDVVEGILCAAEKNCSRECRSETPATRPIAACWGHIAEAIAGERDGLLANLECSRDAERILGERLKAAREILADCRFFIANADLLRRIDASIAQGQRP